MSNGLTLLLIDDCEADRAAYRRYLSGILTGAVQQPYQFVEAESVEEGLTLYQTHPCDAILLDFCLPDGSGLDFLGELKRLEWQAVVPIIMLTGQGDEKIAVQAMKLGAQDYLVKQHLNSDVLQLAVRNGIKQARLQTRLRQTQDRQRLVAATALQIRQSLDLKTILKTAVTEVQRRLSCDRVAVYQLDPQHPIQGWQAFQQMGGHPDAEQLTAIRAAVLEVYEAGHYRSCCLQVLEHLEVSSNQVAAITLPGASGSREQDTHLADGHLPVQSHSDAVPSDGSKLWGLLVAHRCDRSRSWQVDEQEVLQAISVQLAIAIHQAELLTRTQTSLVKEKELNAFKSKIVGTVSHEYRTPLASILAAASTLRQHSHQLAQPQQQKFLTLIEQKARHMANLVEDMLVVNQFELDRAKFTPLPMDLLQFCADIVDEQRDLTHGHHNLSLKLTGTCQGFWGDPGLLRQILVNLLSNAIKYSPTGGQIEFHLMSTEHQVIFLIQDEGIGIPEADQHTLFQSFGRGSNVGTIPGTGLGLSIVKSCVELHGGDIRVTSQMNQGTRVQVTLPKQSRQACTLHLQENATQYT